MSHLSACKFTFTKFAFTRSGFEIVHFEESTKSGQLL